MGIRKTGLRAVRGELGRMSVSPIRDHSSAGVRTVLADRVKNAVLIVLRRGKKRVVAENSAGGEKGLDHAAAAMTHEESRRTVLFNAGHLVDEVPQAFPVQVGRSLRPPDRRRHPCTPVRAAGRIRGTGRSCRFRGPSHPHRSTGRAPACLLCLHGGRTFAAGHRPGAPVRIRTAAQGRTDGCA